jgi:hypothetical protein
MTIQLRRRNNGGQHVIVLTDGNWPKTKNGARKALWSDMGQKRIQAVNLAGIWFMLDRETWDAVSVARRINLQPYQGRFPRLHARWLRLKEKVASWKK